MRSNTTCPDGSKTSTGCSNAALPTEPAAGFDFTNKTWYESRPILRGTPGAPLMGELLRWNTNTLTRPPKFQTIALDGIKGTINNRSGEPVMVQAPWRRWTNGGTGTATLYYSQAILLPGDSIPFMFFFSGDLEIYRIADGNAYGDPIKLRIEDPGFVRPTTEFTPPGASRPANVRTGWKENDYHQEIWGSIDLGVARGNDGWKIPATKPYLDHYPDPNQGWNSDYVIFTVNINHL